MLLSNQSQNNHILLGTSKSYYRVPGVRELSGSTRLFGYKHSSTLLLCATLLCNDKSTLINLSNITDVKALQELLKSQGCWISDIGSGIIVNPSKSLFQLIDTEVTGTIHSSLYLWPVILSIFGQLKLFPIGGCKIGDRSSDH